MYYCKLESIYFFVILTISVTVTVSSAKKENLLPQQRVVENGTFRGWVPIKWITTSTTAASAGALTPIDIVARDLINSFRATHQAPDCVYSTTLAQQASACAQSYALANPMLDPTMILPRFNCANNPTAGIAVSMNSERTSNGIRACIADPTSGWFGQYVNNQDLFPPAIPAYSPLTVDYTQMIWVASTTCGCGVSTSQITETVQMSPQYIWMCMFTPAGNVVSQYPANVKQDI